MVKAVPQRAYRVSILGTGQPDAVPESIFGALASLLQRSRMDVEAMWNRLPYTVGRGLSARDARQLELALQRAGARTRVDPDQPGADRSSLPSVPPIARPKPSELARNSEPEVNAAPMRVMAYLAAGFAVATLLLLLR